MYENLFPFETNSAGSWRRRIRFPGLLLTNSSILESRTNIDKQFAQMWIIPNKQLTLTTMFLCRPHELLTLMNQQSKY